MLLDYKVGILGMVFDVRGYRVANDVYSQFVFASVFEGGMSEFGRQSLAPQFLGDFSVREFQYPASKAVFEVGDLPLVLEFESSFGNELYRRLLLSKHD